MGLRPAAALTRRALAVLLTVTALCGAGCTSRPPDAAPRRSSATAPSATASSAEKSPVRTPTTTPATATPSVVPLDRWKVGAHPLPLRPDGFGRVLPTPKQLRVRRMPTTDLLPPPADGRFHGTVGPVTPEVRRRMGRTWSPSCPVGLTDLRHLTLTFRGFDGKAHTGEMVVNASVAQGVVEVFRTLFRAGFPIEEMRLVTTADLDAPPTGDGNNTAAYVCRTTRGSSVLSAHAYGLAIDLDPFCNPYRKDDLVLPELASAYLDRSWRRPGMVLPGGVAVRAFARAGWTWGGTFTSVSDLMHFSADGR